MRGDGKLVLPLTGYNTKEIRPCTSPEQYSTADPGVGVGTQVSKPRGNNHRRASPATCLSCGGMGKGEMLPLVPSRLWQVGELAPRS